jgi:hypothetical protein
MEDEALIAPQGEGRLSRRQANFTLGILVGINLLNYLDRYTLAGLSHARSRCGRPFFASVPRLARAEDT